MKEDQEESASMPVEAGGDGKCGIGGAESPDDKCGTGGQDGPASPRSEPVAADGDVAPVKNVPTDIPAPKSAKALRRQERKAARRAMRRAKWQQFRTMGPLGRLWEILKIFSTVVVVAAVVAEIALSLVPDAVQYAAMDRMQQRYEAAFVTAAPPELVAQEAPADRLGATQVDGFARHDPAESWAVYVYFCGSDLESQGYSYLSETTRYMVAEEREEQQSIRSYWYRWLFDGYLRELEENGMDLPDYLYRQEAPEEDFEDWGAPVYDGDEAAEQGLASYNIECMEQVELPENIRLVFQTGGSARWSNSRINPNRTQRFVLDRDGLREEADLRPADTCASETLADFLSWCAQEHPADHTVLILWDHGGGAFGFGSDELYDDQMSLQELRTALIMAYGREPEAVPLDLIGFDCCLMSTAEVAESVYGYADYLVGSEELEPGRGWSYDRWLSALAADPGMSVPQLGRQIVDSYVEYYANANVNLEELGIREEVQLSLVDVELAHRAYEDYAAFADEALARAVAQPAALTELGRAAHRGYVFGGSSHAVYNHVDLSALMNNLLQSYPESAVQLLAAVKRAVLYRRATRAFAGAGGLAVYFPEKLEDLTGLIYALDYIEGICDRDSLRTLYYYKISGCLNQEGQRYVREQGLEQAPVLCTGALRRLASAEVEIAENNFRFAVSDEEADLIQLVELELKKREEDGSITAYGADVLVDFDGEGGIQTWFDGAWASLEGSPLALELIDENDLAIRYRAAVSMDGEDGYLDLTYELDSEQFSVNGYYPDTAESDVNTISRLEAVRPGAKLEAIYRQRGANGEREVVYGPTVRFRSSEQLADATLTDGSYLLAVRMQDVRGDTFYSPAVAFEMVAGSVTEMQVDKSYYPGNL